MDFRRFAGEARKRGKQVLDLLKEGAFELSWDVRDATKTGFGVPHLLSSVASLGVATVAAASGSHVALDLIGKVWGKKECATCNGWEGLRCQMCKGSGSVRYHIKESSLPDIDRSSSQSIAAAAVEGRAEVEYITGDVKWDLSLPYTGCPNCRATGVMRCPTCQGDAWVPKFTVDRVMNPPSLAWKAYKKIEPPSEPAEVLEDPAMAAFAMFGRDEIEHGFQYDEELKKALMAKYWNAREYDIVREKVKRREPGWETLQEVLMIKDPRRAARDPVIVTNPDYHKAKVKVWKQVSEFPVPPRPSDWSNIERPLKESDWTMEDLKDPRKRTEMKVLLEGQEKYYNELLDKSWEDHWRAQKFEEVKRVMIEQYEREEGHQQPTRPEAKQGDIGLQSRSPPVSSTKQAKPVIEKKTDVKKRPAEDKKRRERQERSERMARQAVEREAALAKAKTAREGRGVQ